ncbi:hypothetical protein BGX27_000878 [Mortierella sp. AM989]|nr:hypothetical protein BGX27_000878 [Mortierella sp. AM989]
MLALQQSIESTKREKERLWIRIQEQVTSPPPTSIYGLGESGAQGNSSDGSLDVNGSQNLLEVPGTLPIRLTAASPHSPFLDRRKSSNTDAAMSLQFREFDQKLASNSLRRQSLIPVDAGTAPTAPTETTNDTADKTQSNTAANAAPFTLDGQSSDAANSGASSPTAKSKKKVTISDAIKRVSIVEPENVDDVDYDDRDDDAEEEEDEGVVFDLDEELGFDESGKQAESDEDDVDSNNEDDVNDGDDVQSNSNGIAFSSSGRSLPKSEGMIVGSLRANYLRRQRGLQQHKRSINNEDLDFDEDAEDDDYNQPTPSASDAILLGTSLPIQIQPRPANLPPPQPSTRTSAIASSLALPPGSSPAAAMLQRRLSRAYGTELPTEHNAARSARAGSHVEGSSSFIAPTSGATPGTVIIDPLMLLEEEHDNDDREDQLRKYRQPFSAINHRRDMERSLQNQQDHDPTNNANTTLPPLSSSHVSRQKGFEPPHLYSARTYVGATPWEMPTRITVKSGGFQREGSQLDKQIAAEMAKELEMERQEKENGSSGAKAAAPFLNTDSTNSLNSVADKKQQLDSDDLPPNHPFSTAGSTSNDTGERADS